MERFLERHQANMLVSDSGFDRVLADLRLIVDAWPELPEPLRAGILAMVKAVGHSTRRRHL